MGRAQIRNENNEIRNGIRPDKSEIAGIEMGRNQFRDRNESD